MIINYMIIHKENKLTKNNFGNILVDFSFLQFDSVRTTFGKERVLPGIISLPRIRLA